MPIRTPSLSRHFSGYLGLTPASRRRTCWRMLANRNFRLYFIGSVTSDFGTWLQNTAQVLLAYRLSHSVLAVGIVTCAQFSSPLVLGPWAGVFTARFGGRRTLLGTQAVAAVVAAGLSVLEFAGRLNDLGLVAGAIISGLIFTFALPARNVTVRRLVPAEDTEPAFAMDSVSYNLGRAIAPLVSVLLVITAGFGWAFAANSVSFLVFTVVLLLTGRGLARHGIAEPERRSRVRDGFLIARRDHVIMFLLLMVAAVTIADDPVLVLGPALTSQLHVSASWSGWFIAALGAGTVLGSLRRTRHVPSLPLAAIALAMLATCMVFFVMTPWAPVSLIAALGAGVACLIANSTTRTLLAKAAGPAREASVMAVWAIAWAGSKPLASLIDGTLAGWVGIRATGVILALPALTPLAYLFVRRLSAGVARRRPGTTAVSRARTATDEAPVPVAVY